MRSCAPLPFRVEYLHNFFGILMKDLSFLPHVLIYSVIYALIDSWIFILYFEVIIQYDFISLLKLFQFGSLGAPLVVFHAPLTAPSMCECDCGALPYLWYLEIFLVHLISFLPSPRFSHFS